MADYAFEHYTELASRLGPELPQDETARLAFIQGLNIGLPEGCSPEDLSRAVFEEAGIVAAALAGHVPTNRAILLHDSNSLRIGNDPAHGWLVGHVQSPPYRQVQDLDQEHRDPPRPVMLSEEGKLYVYEPGRTPDDRPADGVMRHWYVPAIPSVHLPENSQAMLLGYALLMAAPPVPPAEQA